MMEECSFVAQTQMRAIGLIATRRDTVKLKAVQGAAEYDVRQPLPMLTALTCHVHWDRRYAITSS